MRSDVLKIVASLCNGTTVTLDRKDFLLILECSEAELDALLEEKGLAYIAVLTRFKLALKVAGDIS